MIPTTPVSSAPPPTCTNPDLGYTLTMPAGWQTNGPTALFSGCQLFSTKPFDPATIAAKPLNAPLQLGSIAQKPADLSTGATNTLRVQVAGLGATVVNTILTDPPVLPGTRMYAYLIDRGRTTLAAIMLTAPGASAIQQRANEQTLDAMVKSLQFQNPACHESKEGRCGDFYWSSNPAPNQPITGQVTVTPPEPLVGQTVTFTVTVHDPDANVLETIQVCYGETNAAPCGAPLPGTSSCSILCQLQQSTVGPVHGPWRPPPVRAGAESIPFTHVYQGTGRFHFQAEIRSSNSGAPAGHDPYQSEDTFDTFITVH